MRGTGSLPRASELFIRLRLRRNVRQLDHLIGAGTVVTHWCVFAVDAVVEQTIESWFLVLLNMPLVDWS